MPTTTGEWYDSLRERCDHSDDYGPCGDCLKDGMEALLTVERRAIAALVRAFASPVLAEGDDGRYYVHLGDTKEAMAQAILARGEP